MEVSILKGKIACFIIIMLVAAVIVFEAFGPSDISSRYSKDAIINNADTYTAFADYCYQCYKSDSITNECIVYSYDNQENELYSFSKDKHHMLNDDQIELLNTIKSTFYIGEKNFDHIRVIDNFVVLMVLEDRGTVIYSIDGSKPKFYLPDEQDKCRIYVEKISDHWYFASPHNIF